eukprot:920702-Alexandrium_andersonii.AAC.1
MSASLVGSEMCIRDSGHIHTQAHEDTRKRAHERVQAMHVQAQDRRTVSYTHLTLPTICSV